MQRGELVTYNTVSPPASSTTKTGCHDIAENGIKHQKPTNLLMTRPTCYTKAMKNKLAHICFNSKSLHTLIELMISIGST
jgi:hypothetical protein